MTDRLRMAAVLVVLALGAGGCGGSSSHSAASQATSTSATSPANVAPTTTASTTASTPTASTPTTTGAAKTASTPASQSVATAPPPVPPATPPAPDGLRQTTGYATYELCSSQCSGAVPASLRRPLHLPQVAPGAACPTSAGSGPLGPSPVDVQVQSFIGSAWEGARVTWTASSAYTGPVLIRGRQLGGSGAVGFGEGHIPYDELQLLAPGSGAPPASGGGRAWMTFTRMRTPGCYAYQIDGTSFSDVIVFRAA